MPEIQFNHLHRVNASRSWIGIMALLLVVLGLVGYPLMAWADESPADNPPTVLVRTTLVPKNPVVGQQIEYRVDVFVDTWFAKAPEFPEIQVEDAIALLPPTASINLNERINGQSYAGQRRTYYLFPQLPGRYNLPELSIKVVPAQPGNSAPEPTTLSTAPTDFMASLPAELAAQSDGPMLATPQLQVKTQLATQGSDNATSLKQIYPGDTVEQTVTLTAKDTLASVLPAIAVPDLPGLSAYPDPPQLTNQFTRGQFTASRTEHISYVAEQPGRYQVPEQSIIWWSTTTQSLKTEVIPAIDIRAQPTPLQMLVQLWPWLLGVLTLASGLIYFRQPIGNQWHRYRTQQQASESTRWKQLSQACSENDPRVAWRYLVIWLECLPLPSNTPSLDAWGTATDHAILSQAVKELEIVLFAEDQAAAQAWSGERLLQALTEFRQRHRDQMPPRHQVSASLPPLNPIH